MLMTNNKYKIRQDRDSLSQEAMKSIVRIIRDNKLMPGDKLFTEEKLSTLLNISRSVVREALASLNALGVIKTKHGFGSIVLDYTDHLTTSTNCLFLDPSYENITEVVEVRKIYEIEIARLAALRRTEDDMEEMKRHLKLLGAYGNTIEENVDHDINFHLSILLSTHNCFMYKFLGRLTGFLRPTRLLNFKKTDAVKLAVEEHETILEAIRDQKPDDAKEAMRKHLDNILYKQMLK